MKTQFQTEQEAKKVFDIATAETTHRWCPLINGNCKTACASYYKGEIYHRTLNYWIVDHPRCKNVLITGEICYDQ